MDCTALKPHPLSLMFPPLTNHEMRKLVRDIQGEGLKDAIVVHEGMILDGRHRKHACDELGIQPRFIEWKDHPAPGTSPVHFVISMNVMRRHLTSSQRSVLAADALPEFEKLAQERKVDAGKKTGRGNRKVHQLFDEPLKQAADEAAEAFHTNKTYVSDVKALKEEAPEVVEEIRQGNLTVPKAKAKVRKEKAAKAVSEATAPAGYFTDLGKLAGQKFGCLYIDPPWAYSNKATRAAVGDAEKNYATMSLDAIKAMPIGDLAAENSHLHLWTTNAFLFDAKDVMEAWGFTYKSCFVWLKDQLGIGNYWRVSHEFMLLGVRGKQVALDRSLKSWVALPRTQHSAKPDQIRDMVQLLSPGPYLEVFGRKPVEGWAVFGNEVIG